MIVHLWEYLVYFKKGRSSNLPGAKFVCKLQLLQKATGQTKELCADGMSCRFPRYKSSSFRHLSGYLLSPLVS